MDAELWAWFEVRLKNRTYGTDRTYRTDMWFALGVNCYGSVLFGALRLIGAMRHGAWVRCDSDLFLISVLYVL